LAYWPYRVLRWPVLVINSLMLVSIIPIGMHYVTDGLVGVAICAAVVAAEFAICRLPVRKPAAPCRTGFQPVVTNGRARGPAHG
jgi:membrane-associated phospholipid phosphatase